jgi:hypothetical protein
VADSKDRPIAPPEYLDRLARHGFGMTDEQEKAAAQRLIDRVNKARAKTDKSLHEAKP